MLVWIILLEFGSYYFQTNGLWVGCRMCRTNGMVAGGGAGLQTGEQAQGVAHAQHQGQGAVHQVGVIPLIIIPVTRYYRHNLQMQLINPSK